jgi:hypothetical protein
LRLPDVKPSRLNVPAEQVVDVSGRRFSVRSVSLVGDDGNAATVLGKARRKVVS